MKLKEFEAKQLLQAVGMPISKGVLVTNISEIPDFQGERVVKAQSLAGGRGKAGGVVIVGSKEEAIGKAENILGSTFLQETINEVLLDEKVNIEKELYLGLMFDTSKRCPVLIFSEEGGVDIELLKQRSPEKIMIKEVDYEYGLTNDLIDEILFSSLLSMEIKENLKNIMHKMYTSFTKFDCKMLEVNPLAIANGNKLIAIDAVAVLDDDAKHRRELEFSERTDNRKATTREIAARQIDKDDHRGVAGKTFLDLDGDIAILTSGGGASMTLMDALIGYGGNPANFTEYSGDPPTEKVEKLTRVVLDRENLSGLLIGGVIANFTNIADTLKGVLNVLKEKKPNYPIVIRRAGPNDAEAKEMIMQAKEEYGFDIHFFDEKMPLTKAVNVMMELSNKYKGGLNNVNSH